MFRFIITCLLGIFISNPLLAQNYCPLISSHVGWLHKAPLYNSNSWQFHDSTPPEQLFVQKLDCQKSPQINLPHLDPQKNYFIRWDQKKTNQWVRGQVQYLSRPSENSFRRVFYIHPQKGKDQNSGLSPQMPWKSLERLRQGPSPATDSSQGFAPGDAILLYGGSSFTLDSTLRIPGSGQKDLPITLGIYGPMRQPQWLGRMSQGPILAFKDQEYWSIRDQDFSYVHGDKAEMTIPKAAGIHWLASPERHLGPLRGIRIEGMTIHKIPGQAPRRATDKISAYNQGGIIFESPSGWQGNKNRSSWKDVRIMDNAIRQTRRTGISIMSLEDSYAQKVLIARNFISHSAGDGIYLDGFVGDTLGTSLKILANVVEACCEGVFGAKKLQAPPECGANTAAAALWLRYTQRALVQNNWVRRGALNADGQAFDADEHAFGNQWKQNLSTSNPGGWLAFFSQAGFAGPSNGGNVFEHNISIDDADLSPQDLEKYHGILNAPSSYICPQTQSPVQIGSLKTKELIGFYNQGTMTGHRDSLWGPNRIEYNRILQKTFPAAQNSGWPLGKNWIGLWGNPLDLIFRNNHFHLGSSQYPVATQTLAWGFESAVEFQEPFALNGQILQKTPSLQRPDAYPHFDAIDAAITTSNTADTKYTPMRQAKLLEGIQWLQSVNVNAQGDPILRFSPGE
jgi:hypothetical protein